MVHKRFVRRVAAQSAAMNDNDEEGPRARAERKMPSRQADVAEHDAGLELPRALDPVLARGLPAALALRRRLLTSGERTRGVDFSSPRLAPPLRHGAARSSMHRSPRKQA